MKRIRTMDEELTDLFTIAQGLGRERFHTFLCRSYGAMKQGADDVTVSTIREFIDELREGSDD